MRPSRLLLAALLVALGCASTRDPGSTSSAASPPASTSTSSPASTAAEAPAASAPAKAAELQGAAPGAGASGPPPQAEPTTRTPEQLARDAALAVEAAAVYDAFANRIGGFVGQLTPDAKRILFGSNRDGSPQLYVGEVARPSAPPVPVTKGPERVEWAALTRDGRFVLFTRDRGADENSRIYRVGLDGAGLEDLTPEEGVRHDPPVLPLRRPDLMVYSKRRVTSPASTVLVQRVSGGPARTVYEDPGPVWAIDAAPDGGRALLVRLLSPSESVILELDLERGGTRRVYPPEGKKELVAAAAYSADGRTVFVATDGGGEVSALLALDAGREVRARWQADPPTAMIDQVLASPRGDLLAVRLDAGNRTDLRLLDARTLREKVRPRVPLGTAQLGEFTPDGARLTAALSLPGRPADPYAIDLRSGALAPLREDARPGLAGLARLETSLATVEAFDGKPIPMNVYLPADRAGRRLPVVVSFHGGPSGSSRFAWNPMARFYAGQGYAWIEPNVRGSTGFGRAWELADNRERRGDVLRDMETVNRWVRAQPWADPGRVVIFGGSYGGWVVLMGLTRQEDLWSAGVDLVGVADLRTLLRSTDQLIRALFVDEFGDLEQDAELLAAWSPLPDVDRIRDPLFVYQGANDPRVPRAESDAIVNALRRRGVPVEYMIAPDEGHSLDRRENVIEFLSRTARFLAEHLRTAGAGAGGQAG
jgi:dipeptidyl aminopeptidase/acylaminoacyl peptidase